MILSNDHISKTNNSKINFFLCQNIVQHFGPKKIALIEREGVCMSLPRNSPGVVID